MNHFKWRVRCKYWAVQMLYFAEPLDERLQNERVIMNHNSTHDYSNNSSNNRKHSTTILIWIKLKLMAGNAFSKVAAAIIVLTADPSYAIKCRDHIGERVRGKKNGKEGVILARHRKFWCKVRIDYDPSDDPSTYTTAHFLNGNLDLITVAPTTDPIKDCVPGTKVWIADAPGNKKKCTIVNVRPDRYVSHCVVVCHTQDVFQTERHQVPKHKMWLWSQESEKMTVRGDGFYFKRW